MIFSQKSQVFINEMSNTHNAQCLFINQYPLGTIIEAIVCPTYTKHSHIFHMMNSKLNVHRSSTWNRPVKCDCSVPTLDPHIQCTKLTVAINVLLIICQQVLASDCRLNIRVTFLTQNLCWHLLAVECALWKHMLPSLGCWMCFVNSKNRIFLEMLFSCSSFQ